MEVGTYLGFNGLTLPNGASPFLIVNNKKMYVKNKAQRLLKNTCFYLWGKTTVLVELIAQLVSRGQKVLVCAPSNVAVDNLVERLHKIRKPRKLNLVRLGHPARVMDSVLNHTLDSLVNKSEERSFIRDLQKQMHILQKKISKTKVKYEKKQMYNQIKDIR